MENTKTCIDIGGTKTLICNVSPEGKIIDSLKFKTPQNYPDLIKEISKQEQFFGQSAGVVVVGAPGKMNRRTNSFIGFGKLPWKNVALPKDLGQKINRPVIAENDANLAALGEYNQLDPLPHQALYVTVSTGIGGGLVTDGKLDPDHLDMEIGEMLIEVDGQLLMFEKVASGSALVAKFGQLASELEDPDAWRYICHHLAHGFINLMSFFSPDVIIIGGGVGTHFAKYQTILNEELAKLKPELVDIPPIVQAKQPEEAVIIGAWHLANQSEAKSGVDQ